MPEAYLSQKFLYLVFYICIHFWKVLICSIISSVTVLPIQKCIHHSPSNCIASVVSVAFYVLFCCIFGCQARVNYSLSLSPVFCVLQCGQLQRIFHALMRRTCPSYLMDRMFQASLKFSCQLWYNLARRFCYWSFYGNAKLEVGK